MSSVALRYEQSDINGVGPLGSLSDGAAVRCVNVNVACVEADRWLSTAVLRHCH